MVIMEIGKSKQACLAVVIIPSIYLTNRKSTANQSEAFLKGQKWNHQERLHLTLRLCSNYSTKGQKKLVFNVYMGTKNIATVLMHDTLSTFRIGHGYQQKINSLKAVISYILIRDRNLSNHEDEIPRMEDSIQIAPKS